jgi:hypothetical protein
MPTINNKKNIKTTSFTAKINVTTSEQIINYCAWAGIYDTGYFLEKATAALLSLDPDWEKPPSSGTLKSV